MNSFKNTKNSKFTFGKMAAVESLLMVVVLLILPRSLAIATIVKGPLAFHDDAFADSARMITGTVGSFSGGATDVNDALTGDNLTKAFEIGEFNQGEMVELAFLDNPIINGPDFDLVVFEKIATDGFDVAVDLGGGLFSTFIHYEPVSEGFSEGGSVNAARINLDDFGLKVGSITRVIRILEDNYDSAELAGAGAYNIPEPSSFVMVLSTSVMGSLLFTTRRRKWTVKIFGWDDPF